MTTLESTHPAGSLRRLFDRLKAKPIVAAATVGGMFGGPLFAFFLFPELALYKQVLGGGIAGFYFALCAAPEHFLEF